MDGDGELLQVVDRLRACGRSANLLDGRQQQTNQDGDDGDHDQQFDERERSTAVRKATMHGPTPRKKVVATETPVESVG